MEKITLHLGSTKFVVDKEVLSKALGVFQTHGELRSATSYIVKSNVQRHVFRIFLHAAKSNILPQITRETHNQIAQLAEEFHFEALKLYLNRAKPKVPTLTMTSHSKPTNKKNDIHTTISPAENIQKSQTTEVNNNDNDNGNKGELQIVDSPHKQLGVVNSSPIKAQSEQQKKLDRHCSQPTIPNGVTLPFTTVETSTTTKYMNGKKIILKKTIKKTIKKVPIDILNSLLETNEETVVTNTNDHKNGEKRPSTTKKITRKSYKRVEDKEYLNKLIKEKENQIKAEKDNEKNTSPHNHKAKKGIPIPPKHDHHITERGAILNNEDNIHSHKKESTHKSKNEIKHKDETDEKTKDMKEKPEETKHSKKEKIETEHSKKDKENTEKLMKEKEEAERLRKEEEAERLRKEEEERLRKEKEEEERLRKEKEEEERLRKEKEEEERLRKEKEEEERLKKEKAEELRKQKEEEERLRKEKEEEERLRKQKEEEERLRKQKEEEERLRKEKEEAEQLMKAKEAKKPENQARENRLNEKIKEFKREATKSETNLTPNNQIDKSANASELIVSDILHLTMSPIRQMALKLEFQLHGTKNGKLVEDEAEETSAPQNNQNSGFENEEIAFKVRTARLEYELFGIIPPEGLGYLRLNKNKNNKEEEERPVLTPEQVYTKRKPRHANRRMPTRIFKDD